MDWAKAKTVLIIALIITDIFLLFNFVSGRRTAGEIDNTEMLKAVLAESGINVSEIPAQHQDMPALSVRYEAADQAEVDALIASAGIEVDVKNIGHDDPEAARAYIEAAEDFVKYLGMMSDYAEAEFIPAGDTGRDNKTAHGDANVLFRCVRNNYEVDGSYMLCSFDDGRLTGFESHWLEPVEFSGRKLPTISASVALISYMTDRADKAEVDVEDIEMVYWVSMDTYEGSAVVADTALPAWRLTLADGTTVHIDAIER